MRRPRTVALACVVVLVGQLGSTGASAAPPPSPANDLHHLLFVGISGRDADGANTEVYRVRQDGGAMGTLTTDGDQKQLAGSPSPDGTLVAYAVGTRFGSADLKVVDVFGVATRLLATDVGGEPSWSPLGDRVAAIGGGAVVIAPLDGSGLSTAFSIEEGGPQRVRWAPVGERLAVTTYFLADDTVIVERLWLTDADGSDSVEVHLPGGYAGEVPDWAPDASTFVVSDAAGDLVVVGSNGDVLRRVGVSGRDPAWSPDGRRIAYVSHDGTELRVVGVDGAGDRVVPTPDVDGVFEPRWSDDGRLLAFSGNVLEPIPGTTNQHDSRLDIYVVHVADGTMRRLPNPTSLADPRHGYGVGARFLPTRFGSTAGQR